MSDDLTDLQRMILKIIQDADEALTRTQIAEALGKKRLTQHDIILLERLANSGLIKAEKAIWGVAGKRWEYRKIN